MLRRYCRFVCFFHGRHSYKMSGIPFVDEQVKRWNEQALTEDINRCEAALRAGIKAASIASFMTAVVALTGLACELFLPKPETCLGPRSLCDPVGLAFHWIIMCAVACTMGAYSMISDLRVKESLEPRDLPDGGQIILNVFIGGIYLLGFGAGLEWIMRLVLGFS